MGKGVKEKIGAARLSSKQKETHGDQYELYSYKKRIEEQRGNITVISSELIRKKKKRRKGK